ncbi:MAG TPA: class I lanthipeptide [Chitinophaga sp.]|uniref:class I lanthipeptide n=1 Tax=Chitinophaga sp. TaxID=1869181 RepID=UPI002B6F4512|nr:class I lanthipeptide [Chitinophaga sp.]HVI47259.1 class I lanthipeptide [Chitinophaga sp.]
MKKKKVALSKKLYLDKAPVAELQTSQQYSLLGGASNFSICITNCTTACDTSPRPGQMCC